MLRSLLERPFSLTFFFKVDPKRPQVQPPNQANQERDVVAARTNGSKTGPKSNSGAQVPNQPAEDSPKKVAAGWFEAGVYIFWQFSLPPWVQRGGGG